MLDESSKFFAQKNIEIRYSDMDYKKVLKPSAMLDFLQDVAIYAADICHFGYNETVVNNIGWFVLKYHLEFEKYPQDVENLLIKTEARGVNRLFASRDFEIYDNKNNELLGRVISHWALVNFEDKSLLNPAEVFPFIYPVTKREDDLKFEKIAPITRVDYSEEFKIRYDDIDVNHHVNNINYITWGLETLPKSFKENHIIKTIDINYKKEIQYGNTVVVDAQLDDNIANITVKNKADDDISAMIKIEYK